MTNARQEFFQHIGIKDVLCAQVILNQPDFKYEDKAKNITCNLTTGWTKEDWNEFIKSLDFEYDSGYGTQELFGCIWYQDGSWSMRGEYDGSEWWEYHTQPQIPEELDRKDKVRDQKIDKITQ